MKDVEVERGGSFAKCFWCDLPPTKEVHCWVDWEHCTTVFVCEEHFRKKLLRDFDGGRFVNFGWQKL